MLNKDKLENLLLSNWTEFIDFKQLLSQLETIVNKKPHQIKFSRFELTSQGFLLWIDFKIDNKDYTLEAILNQDKFEPKELINIKHFN